MPVGAVLANELYTEIIANENVNSASLTLNFAPTLVVATASIASYYNDVNAVNLFFLANAFIESYETSQGGGISSSGHVLTSNDVVSITFQLTVGANVSGEIGLHYVYGSFVVLGFV
jgi:hypothetical protein